MWRACSEPRAIGRASQCDKDAGPRRLELSMAAKSKAKAACVIGWPVEHSRSPLIHNYWIKQHGSTPSTGARRSRRSIQRFHHAPVRARLCRRQHHDPAQGGGARAAAAGRSRAAVGAANTLWLDSGEASLDQHRRRRLHRQSRRRRAGLGPRWTTRWCSAPAARRARSSTA